MSTAILEIIKSAVYAAWTINPDRSKDLTQVAEDIWITDRPIATHTDPTKDGHFTYCLVLLNELDLCLREIGEDRYLRPLGVYEIDARKPHGAYGRNGGPKGLFAALIWDMPETDLDRFRTEATARINEWLGEPPVLYSCI